MNLDSTKEKKYKFKKQRPGKLPTELTANLKPKNQSVL
jgi:hypothetical protein